MAQLINGKDVADRIRVELKVKAEGLAGKNGLACKPGLAIVQVGDLAESSVYIRTKLKVAEEIGIEATHVKLPR